jgi:uncharacterized protein (TIGR03546 family)
MFLSRKIGAFLRGNATRGQVFAAALLAGLLGFVPGFFLPGDLGGGFLQAPALILGLLFLAFVLNANLGVFGLVMIAAKLLSFALLPVSFQIGRLLLDGPLQPLFRALVNAPVSAWFGLEYYATTGGLVLGALFGTASGVLLVKALASFRQRMAAVEATSAAYQAHAGKRWARFSAWLLFGKGKRKATWQELAEGGRKAPPVRWAGVALVALAVAGLWVFQGFFSTPLLTSGVRSGLMAANGATVDLERASLDLAAGSLRVEGLAIADSAALDRDLFAAAGLEATIDTGALLRKRFIIDRVRATSARSGSPRSKRGELVAAPEPPPPEPPAGARTLDDWLRDVELWRARLVQAREWFEFLTASDDAPPAARTPEENARRVEEAARTAGYAHVVADQLRDELPLVLIRAIDVEDIACAWLPGEKVDLHVRNWSTDAWLLAEPPQFEAGTRSGSLQLHLRGPSKETPGAAIDFALQALPVDSVFGQLRVAGQPPLRGGTLDLRTAGSLRTHPGAPSTVDLPLQVTLHDTVFALAGARETNVERLVLPVGVRGPVTRPVIAVDDASLADALVQAGKQELASFVKGKAGSLLGTVPGAAPLLESGKTPAELLEEGRKQAEAQARKAAEDAAKKAAEDAAKKGVDGLKGLLPGRKQ